MNKQLIVTHCLALMGKHAGMMSQADKDFFDARVGQVLDTEDIFVSVLMLLTMRLSLDLPQQEAEQTAVQLAEPHAERYGFGLRA